MASVWGSPKLPAHTDCIGKTYSTWINTSYLELSFGSHLGNLSDVSYTKLFLTASMRG